MGRNAGWLTAASALARDGDSVAPHLIYLPEIPFSVDKFVEDVKGKLNDFNSVIVVVSEGIKDENGNYIELDENHQRCDAQKEGKIIYFNSINNKNNKKRK